MMYELGQLYHYLIGITQTIIFWGLFIGVNWTLKEYVFKDGFKDVVINFTKYTGLTISAFFFAVAIFYGLSVDGFWNFASTLVSNEQLMGAVLEGLGN